MSGQPIQFRKNPTTYGQGTDTNRMWSPSIWDRCPLEQIANGTVEGVVHGNDFESMPLIGTQTTQIAYDQYKVFATSGAAVTPSSAVNSVELSGGILALTHNADNDSASLAHAYPAWRVSGDKTTSNKLWFECRIAVKSLLTLRNGFFVGLAESNLFTLATGVPFNGDAAVPTNGGSVLGFNKWEIVSTTAAATTGLPGGINTCYNDRAVTFTQIQADAAIMSAAFTFIKLGIIYDPWTPSRAVRFFADGGELSSVLTNTQILATTNLKAKSLGLMLASVAAASVSTDATYLDYWRIAQVGVGEMAFAL